LIYIQSQFVGLLPNIQLSVTLDHHYSVATFATAVTLATLSLPLLPLRHRRFATVATFFLSPLSPSSCHFCHCREAALLPLLPLLRSSLVTFFLSLLPLPQSGTLPALLPGPGRYWEIFKAD
jgi:hypothetical protein